MRKELLAVMRRTGDPLAQAFAERDKPEILAAAKQKLKDEYERPQKAKAKAKGAQGGGQGRSRCGEGSRGRQATDRVGPAGRRCGDKEPVTLAVEHHFPQNAAEQTITITMLGAQTGAHRAQGGESQGRW